MSQDRPARSEIEVLTAAIERGWVPPDPPECHLDFAATLLSAMKDATPVYDDKHELAGYRGVRLRSE